MKLVMFVILFFSFLALYYNGFIAENAASAIPWAVTTIITWNGLVKAMEED